MAIAAAACVPSASAASGLTIQRVEGEDRYSTAVRASQDYFPSGGSSTVVIASGTSTVDALAASYLAGRLRSPVLLTRPETLPAETAAELRRLGARKVVLAGGEAVISAAVQQQLAADHDVVRAGGADRYETAALLTTVEPASTAPSVVLVASGATDAAAAAPLAAAEGWPVLLTDGRTASPATVAALAALKPGKVVVLGGEGAVSATAAIALGATQRLSGGDRFATATAIADWAVTEADFSRRGVGLALGAGEGAGADLADALVSGPVLGLLRAPLLLSARPDALGPTTADYLRDHAVDLSGTVTVFGGARVVTDVVVVDVGTSTGSSVPRVDATAPVLLSSSPATGTAGVGSGVSPTATFDEPLSLGRSSAVLTAVGPGALPVPATVSVTGNGLTIDPAANLTPGSEYRLAVTAVDRSGNSTVVLITFTVQVPVVIPPVVVPPDVTVPTITPQAARPRVTDTSVTFTADEAIDPATLAVTDFAVSGGGAPTVTGATWTAGTRSITVALSGPLPLHSTVTLSGTLSDPAGNATVLHPATAEVLLRPTAATFADGGSGGKYGDDDGDAIEVTFDGPIVAPGAGYAFWLDQSATVTGQGFGTGTALPATYNGNKVTFTITNAPSISGIDVPVASGVALWSMANLPANARHPDVDPAVRQPVN